jgi:arabinoxylan arabinofuranohydrolase
MLHVFPLWLADAFGSSTIYTTGRAFCLYEFTSKGSPLVEHISAADPDAHVWDNTIWVYCSKDANLRDYGKGPNDNWSFDYMDGYHAFSSTDMVHWVDHGEIFHSRDVAWGPPGWMWAPTAAWNGKRGDSSLYYLYYPHKDWQGEWRIGVATAPTPAGPFTDIGAPMKGLNGIDPHVFIDDDKQVYLYFNTAAVVKLKDNMIEIAEEPRSIEFGENSLDPKFRFEEGSFMHKRGNVYYYSYSNWQARDTTSYYATGKSPYGPFKWKGGLSGKKSGSQDHHSIIKFKGRWYYFYHMDTPWYVKKEMGWYGQRRIACYTQMYYSWDKSIKLVNPTSILLNSGGMPYTTKSGDDIYEWDLWNSESGIKSTDVVVGGTSDPTLYQTYRFGQSFNYDIPLAKVSGVCVSFGNC